MANNNDSSTGGPLIPAPAPAPLEGQDLNRFLQQWIVGILNIDGSLVRPRWQPEPPDMPDAGTAWVAVGVVERSRESAYPFVGHNAAGGYDELQSHEELRILCSFYCLGAGGQADALAAQLRDGLAIDQNLEPLTLANFGFVETGDTVAVPTLTAERWNYRLDMDLVVRREIIRQYPVRNVASAQATLAAQASDDSVLTRPIVVTSP